MLYKYMLLDDIVTGKEICLLLYEQGVLEYDEETVGRLQNGSYLSLIHIWPWYGTLTLRKMKQVPTGQSWNGWQKRKEVLGFMKN